MQAGKGDAHRRRRAASLHPGLALRLAWRQFRRAPGSTVYAALTLSIGLGAATAIDSVRQGFDAPLPVPDGERVVQVRIDDPAGGRSAIAAADLEAWRSQSHSLSRIGAFATFSAAARVPGKPARLVQAADVAGATLELLRVTPALGRLPTEQAVDEGAVVVSQQLWQEWLDSDPSILGRTLRLRGRLHTVVGVMPHGCQFPFREDLWVVRNLDLGNWTNLQVVARLADGAQPATAGQELTTILSRTRRATTGVESTARVLVRGFTEARGESGETTMLFGLLLMVLALVLVSCSNVSNLLLERAAARARSLSVHQALGAAPGQIVLQIFTEALLIGALGVALGLGVAWGAVKFIEASLADHWGYFWMRVQVESSALAFAGALGLVTAVASGTLPAWRTLRVNLAQALKQEAQTSRGLRRTWGAWTLMSVQVAGSCAAVISSVLMGLGLLASRQVERGFPATSVLWTTVTLDGERYETADARQAFRRTFLAELERDPAMRRAALSTGLPGLRSPIHKVTIDGRPVEKNTPTVLTTGVTPRFFSVFDIQVLDGDGFDVGASKAVAVVSRDFVRLHVDGPAIGRTITLHGHGTAPRDVRIIGVAENVVIHAADRTRDLHHIYVPIDEDDAREIYVTVRSAAERADVARAVARAAQAADPEVPIGSVSSLAELLAYVRQFLETLGTLAILGGLGAMLVVTIGLYGIISFEVQRRIPEFAVRLALGAGPGRLMWSVLRHGLLLIVPGVTLGLGLTYLVTPLFGVYLGGSQAHDPRVFAGALVIYAVVALLAAGPPARRAASCNPAEVLKKE